MSVTQTDFYRRFFKDLLDRPQDAQQTLSTFGTSVGVALAIARGQAAVKAEHAAVMRDIKKAITVKTYYDCLTLIAAHPTRWGLNQEIARRCGDAISAEISVTSSLEQLINQGGVDTQMQLQLVATQQLAESRAKVDLEKAIGNGGWITFDLGNRDQVFNVCENKISAAILRKLIELTLNDVPDTYDTPQWLQKNRHQRIVDLKILYPADRQSTNLIIDYYLRLKESIKQLPSNKPFRLPLSSKNMPILGSSSVF